MNDRLSDETLNRLPASVVRPAYNRAGLRTGIVHLGLGAFHRAHQAVYTEAAIAAGDMRWGTTGVSLRSPDTRDALMPQDGLYTVAVRDGGGEALQVVGNLGALLVAPEETAGVLDALCHPDVRIVSLTITEKGYCHLPATGELDETRPEIARDLADPVSPRSAIGFLVEAIHRRRGAGAMPLTLLSCDNLPANGRTLARVVTRFAALRDRGLGDYVEGEIAFPSTMVDRIVPATTEEDRRSVQAALGVRDAWPVATEPFSQWVIEDRFPQGRPAWDVAGATFSADVTPFELMKLRLLNASHSTLAYLGYLAGHDTVSDAMAAPGFEALVTGLMEKEASPTLPALRGVDVPAYCRALRARFRNPALKHRTWQIAMDGSQKIPQRLLGTVRDRIAAGEPFERLALGIAAWMRYASGRDGTGGIIDVRDPMAERIAGAVGGRLSPDDIADAYLGFSEIFGPDLPRNEGFRSAVTSQLRDLLEQGAARTVAQFGSRMSRAPHTPQTDET